MAYKVTISGACVWSAGGVDVKRSEDTTHGADPTPVEVDDTSASLLWAARHARDLRQTGRYRRHRVLYDVQHKLSSGTLDSTGD